MIRVDPRQWYRRQPGCLKSIFQVIGANALIYAHTEVPGSTLFLLQQRKGGYYSAIGGASDLFVDDKNCVVGFESQEDTLFREFFEETGHALLESPCVWNFIGCFTSVIHYHSYPSVHGVGTYYSIQTTTEHIRQYASGGSYEGRIIILNTKEVLQALQNNLVLSNTEPALRKLLQTFGITL